MNAHVVSTAYAYDDMNRLTEVVQAPGEAEEAITLTRYDAVGNVTETVAPGFSGTVTTRYAYDAQYNRIAAIENVNTTGQLSRLTTSGFDRLGNLLWTAVGGRVTTYAYDELYRRTMMIESVSVNETRTTNFKFDKANNVTQVVSGQSSNPANSNVQTVTYEYDRLYRQTAIIDPAGGTTKLAYDSGNNVVVKIDAVRNVTQIAYDPLGRATKLTEGQYLSPNTNDLNNIVNTPDTRYQMTGYDASGNVLIQSVSIVPDEPIALTEKQYDSLNRVTTITQGRVGNTVYLETKSPTTPRITSFSPPTVSIGKP